MQDCDFIPDHYREAQGLRRATKIRASCVGALIAFMVLWVVAHQHRLAEVKAMAVDVARQQNQVDIHLGRKQTMEAERAELRARRQLISQLESDGSLVVVFSDISRRMPETIVLTELSVQRPSLSRYAIVEEPPEQQIGRGPPGKKRPAPDGQPYGRPTGDRITIKGVAADIPQIIEFAAALEDSPLFERIRRDMPKEETFWAGRVVRRFELTCDLVKQVEAGR